MEIATTEQSEASANLFWHIMKILEIKPHCDLENLGDAAPHAAALAEKLGISPRQAVIFSFVLETQEERPVSLTEIARNINMPKLNLMQYMGDFNALADKRLLRVYHGSGRRYEKRPGKEFASYLVGQELIDTLARNEAWTQEAQGNLSEDEFFEKMDSLFQQKMDMEIGFEFLTRELSILVSDNQHLEFTQKLKPFDLDIDAFILLLACCNQAMDDDQRITQSDVEMLYNNRMRGRGIWRVLEAGNHPLQNLGLVENANAGGFGDTGAYTLTGKAKEDILGDLAAKPLPRKKFRGFIEWGEIQAKELIYNDEDRERIETLQSLLQEENYQNIRRRLLDSGMRTGFACLFSGEPGTGKTETAFQLAKDSGRDIMKVEIAASKSKWFGESERIIKGIFEKYRNLAEDAEKNGRPAPILLFNEADGVFSKRRTLGDERSGPEQTENAMQNIILEEMETLKGILIATTNLAVNLDKAFERRFIYKIEFSKPDRKARAAIWRAMAADMGEAEAEALAVYDFSGGQIENILRKRAVEIALKGEAPSLEAMMAFCRDEKPGRKAETSIGFRV